MHLYENHLGGYYIADEHDEGFLEICEMCGDNDWYVGSYDTIEEIALEMYKCSATNEHIADVTGLKVKVTFEKVE